MPASLLAIKTLVLYLTVDALQQGIALVLCSLDIRLEGRGPVLKSLDGWA